MKIHRSVRAMAALAAVGATALGASGAAQARDVFWSVGVASPGVQVGVSNAPPVVYQRPVFVPQPVYYGQPQVVYTQPQVVYTQPQVVYQPQPYYVQSAWAAPVYYPGWGARQHWRHGRWDRGDERRGFNDGRLHDGRR